MPILYPDQEHGGMRTRASYMERKKRIRDDNPSMVDALLLMCLRDNLFGDDLEKATEYLQYFRKGWDHTVGHRVKDGIKDIDGNMEEDAKFIYREVISAEEAKAKQEELEEAAKIHKK